MATYFDETNKGLSIFGDISKDVEEIVIYTDTQGNDIGIYLVFTEAFNRKAEKRGVRALNTFTIEGVADVNGGVVLKSKLIRDLEKLADE